jgi:hypothetical protein
MHQEIKGQLC